MSNSAQPPQSEAIGSGSSVADRVRRYARRAETLRQIHSDKAFRTQRASRWYTVLTVIASGVLTLLGFAGPERLSTTFLPSFPLSDSILEAALNWAILIIVVLAILGLVFRFDERSAQHYRSIEKLTEFIRDVQDLASVGATEESTLSVEDLDRVRSDYEAILKILPPSTDKEYFRSKHRLEKKRRAKQEQSRDGGSKTEAKLVAITDSKLVDQEQLNTLTTLMAQSDRLATLRLVRDRIGSSFWITGGFVRNAVWDDLSHYDVATPLEDVDVIYFETGRPAEDDDAFKRSLAGARPNIAWSVTNQALVHQKSHEEASASLTEAVSRFPESASAIAIQLDSNGFLRVLAPYGLQDLFDGVVRRSESAAPSNYEKRLEKKRWAERWPILRVEA